MKASERRWYLPWPALVKCVMVLAVLTAVKGDTIYMNQFAVRVPGGAAVAEDLARRLGFTNLWQIGTLQNYFVLEHKRIAKRSAAPGVEHHRALREATEVTSSSTTRDHIVKVLEQVQGASSRLFMSSLPVEWVQQQVEHRRTKRDIYPSRNSTSRTREKRSRSPQSLFPDPLYKEQWYLNGATAESLDMRIPDAWAKGYTGKGIVVSILDDGIQSKHPDLMANYDPLASGDINDNDTDPAPRDDGDNKHGTRCAGEVAAEAFNDVCGVGVAYRASIGGVRMLDGTVNDAVEAAALSTNPSHIDIYSASWGPEDDGKTVDGPGPLARRAFLQGVTNGRKGKGSIFVWASGNGGRHTDSCNCDGYTNSIFTLSISSATQYGYKPWYLEECSSTLATTYSSGTPGRDKSVATVDMDGKLRPGYICTTDHTGTSASAPLAAGMCALALEANSQLTWRDMQHLVVRSSRAAPLEKESGWSVNGAKRRVSHKFGYGLIDASAMVALAETWTPVPPQHICKSQVLSEERPIDRAPGTAIEMQVDVNGCRGTANEIRFLEHVQCRVTLTFAPRGALRIVLTSPMGTTSTLLSERPLDDSESLDDWAFLSVHFWGERADGRWTLRVENNANKPIARPGVLRMWQLVLYGTATDPTPQNGSSSSNNAVVDRSQQPGVIDGAAVAVELVPLVNSVAGDSRSGIEYQTEVVATPPPHRLILHDCDHECLEAAGCYGRGPTVCVACKHYKLDNTCVSRCPPRSYLSRDATCQPCHETCETCAGPGHDACLTCAPAHLRLADLGVCIQECPESYYEDAARLSCIACSANCLSCGEQPDRCTTCDRLLVMHNQRCFAACPPGTFNVTADRCEECHPSCDTCSGPGESQCISCPSGRLFLSGACLRACPEGWFPDKRVHECAACPLGCTLCTTQGCRVCAAGWVLGPDGRCARDGAGRCNPGEYVNGTTCTQCHSSCATCHSDGPDACLSCPPDAPLLFAGRCRAVCPDGSFPVVGSPPGDTDLWTTIGSNGHIIDPGPARCARCPHNCRSCVSRQNCTACSPGLRLQSGQCRVACADGYYSDGGVCAACYLSCATCTGPHKDECVTCPRGWQLLDGQCHPDCPQGHYTTRFGCAKCHHTCRSCIGPGPANCSSCVARRALTSDGRCTLCVRGEFYDAANRRCAPCHPSCAACAGPGRLACTACIPPLQLHKRRSQCMPCCGPTPSALAAAVGDDGPAADACCKCDSHTDSGICPDVSSAGKRRIAEPSLDWRPSSGSASSAQLPGLINPSVAVASSEVAASLVRTEDALPQVYSWPLPNATTTATLAAAAVAAATIVIAVVVTVIRTRQRRLPNQSSVLTGEVETPKLEGCVSNGFRITDDSFRVTLSRGRGRGRSHRTKSSQAEQQCLLAANSCEDVDDLDSLSLPT